MLVRSLFIALGLISATWASAIYHAHQNKPTRPIVASVEIGEPIIISSEVVHEE